jgi:hypothetical protein
LNPFDILFCRGGLLHLFERSMRLIRKHKLKNAGNRSSSSGNFVTHTQNLNKLDPRQSFSGAPMTIIGDNQVWGGLLG